MKRFITIVVTIFCASTLSAQNLQRIEGIVQDNKGVAIANASLKIQGTDLVFKTSTNGTFSIDVPSIAHGIIAETENHKPKFLEIDGTYMVFNLAPKPYANTEKGKAEQARIAEQKDSARKAREQATKAVAEKRRKDYSKVQKGFGSIVNVSCSHGFNYSYPSVGISYTAGYKFNNQIYLGGGVGANLNIDGGQAIRSVLEQDSFNSFLNPCLISVPVFVYFRANFIDRRCSPFFAISAGGNFSPKQTLILDLYNVQYSTIGAFINPQLGVNFRTTTKTSVYLALGFQGFTAPLCFKYTGYNAMLRSAFGYGVDLHFGFTF